MDQQEERLRVLIVEDDVDLLEFISSGLEDQFEVHCARDGKEGLDRALEWIPDLVVTDIMMPKMNGLELCAELKTNPCTSHIPVIMLTAKTSVESQLEGLETGADDYITKPFLMVLLEARIKNLLQTRRMLREQFSRQLGSPVNELPLHNQADRELWEKISAALAANYADPDFCPDALARLVHMSSRTLQRKIKALTDRSPVSLILHFRLEKGAELLLQDDLNITDIAFDVGFSDSNHFYRQFKSEYGKSPSRFRREALGE